MIWLADGCTVDPRSVSSPETIVLERNKMIGAQYLWDLRRLSSVTIPDGVQLIESHWFGMSQIKAVAIPASVREIGDEAFRGCRRLTQVTFAENSNLETIGVMCFAESGLREIELPRSLKAIGRDAFKGCKHIWQNGWLSEYTCEDGLVIEVLCTAFKYYSRSN